MRIVAFTQYIQMACLEYYINSKGVFMANIRLIKLCAYFIKTRYSSTQLNYSFCCHILSCLFIINAITME